ncbi:heptaprenylglyceryl phosphate synthase [Halorussus salilacus]|uniref:heptaprenylglyceryl phosphate synthase n=1 Tax=Halorussus salilacus TaxID=2953750 RepID=UPI00209D0A33|nr:heptaprenylglyceryl phosphate synthase [Halorussus salilacus]USZ68703.1 heptaprenylglyceryl phosphate synthase [Halorussus salilacus]
MTNPDEFARLLGRVGRGVALGARTVLPLDTNPVPAEWTHVTKVDPEHAKKLPLLFPLYLRHTGAVSVGGSDDVTAENTEETFDLLAPTSVPVFHEPSGPRHVTRRTREQADLLAVPEVLNGDSESLVGQLGTATEYVREELVPDLLREEFPWLPAFVADPLADFATSWFLSAAVFEAYIIQNPDSAAAREANVGAADLLTPREAKQRAMAAERHLESELVYLEYSGTYGGEEATEILDAVADGLTWSRLWYGGGLDSRERVEDVLAAGADAVVVGDAFHRVADEEADLCERAVGELDSEASASRVREWVGERVDAGESAAAAYLATIPSVADPERLAERYLALAVRTWLGLRRLADERSEDDSPSARDAPRALVAADSPWLADVSDGLGEADAAVVRRVLRALLADGVGEADAPPTDAAATSGGAGASPTAPTSHFAVSLSRE